MNVVNFVLLWKSLVTQHHVTVIVESVRGYLHFDYVNGQWWHTNRRISDLTVMGIIGLSIDDGYNVFVNGEDVLQFYGE